MPRVWTCKRCGGPGPHPCPVQMVDAGVQTDNSSTTEFIASLQQELAWTRDQLQAAFQARAATEEQTNNPQSPGQQSVIQAPGIQTLHPVECLPSKALTSQAPDSSENQEFELLHLDLQSFVKEEEEEFQPQVPSQPAPTPFCEVPAGDDSGGGSFGGSSSNGRDVLLAESTASPSPVPSVGIDEDPLRLTPRQAPDSDAADSHTELDGSSDEDHGGSGRKDEPWPVAKSSKPGAKRSKRRGNGRPFPCPFCDRSFFTEKGLTWHKVQHQGGKPFTCNMCQRQYRHPASMQRHQAAAHGLGRAYPCEQCGKVFGTRQGLTFHTVTHTGERPYACSKCDQRFAQKTGLQAHERVHHGAPRQKHICATCGRTFATSRSLQIHMRTHTGERPFLCPDCGNTFRHQAGLLMHRRIHSDERSYKCTLCDRSFKTSTALYGHKKTHDKVRPHVCSLCCKSFVRKAALVHHQLLHSGERPHQCADCGQGFIRSTRLAEHRRTAHGQTGQQPGPTAVGQAVSNDR